ncbi:MAG: ATP-binding protein [Candidatus Hodarchaeales archaeon]|jgi:NAD-dependent dihydropyrimidine dehydrogenase PreA subunit
MSDSTLDTYKQLAETLNKIPNGYPKSKDGLTYLKILEWIFTEDEADLASQMKLMGETIEELSNRLNKPISGFKEKIEKMVKQGQIQAIDTSTGRRYGLMPFIGGIFEEQLNRMDSEFAQLMGEYLEQFQDEHIFNTEPAFFRIIPINEVIKPELIIYPFEQAHTIIEQAKSWGIRECICKERQRLLGNPCKYPKTVCLNFSKKADAFENHSITRPITKEQALFYLQKAEEAGLIHNSMNVKSGHYMLCNCCTCCCGILQAVSKWNYPLAYVKSNFQIEVKSDLCKGCGTCVERCQFEALEVNEEICSVKPERCVGCGVCAITCTNDALSLVALENPIQTSPPATLRDWMAQKALSRNVDPSELL